MKHNTLLPCLCILLASSIASGCTSTKDNFSERLSEQGNAKTSIAESYAKGETLIKKGEAKISKGRKMVNKGENQQSAGRKQVSRGEEMKRAAKAEYCQQDAYQDPICQ